MIMAYKELVESAKKHFKHRCCESHLLSVECHVQAVGHCHGAHASTHTLNSIPMVHGIVVYHCFQQEVATLYGRVAAASSELENQTISMDDAQSTVSWQLKTNTYLPIWIISFQLHNEQVRKQFEIDNLQHTLDIEKGALDQKKKVEGFVKKNAILHAQQVTTSSYLFSFLSLSPSPSHHPSFPFWFQRLEDNMKLQQMEKHAMEKRLMDLQQDLQQESTAEKEHLALIKQ